MLLFTLKLRIIRAPNARAFTLLYNSTSEESVMFATTLSLQSSLPADR